VSHCDRILAILADREFHEKSEFYGFCVLHSRVAELRKRGYRFEIEKRDGGRTVWYRLLTEAPTLRFEASGNSRAPAVPALPMEAARADGRETLVGAASEPLQLELVA
jgi:hypothetical protein